MAAKLFEIFKEPDNQRQKKEAENLINLLLDFLELGRTFWISGPESNYPAPGKLREEMLKQVDSINAKFGAMTGHSKKLKNWCRRITDKDYSDNAGEEKGALLRLIDTITGGGPRHSNPFYVDSWNKWRADPGRCYKASKEVSIISTSLHDACRVTATDWMRWLFRILVAAIILIMAGRNFLV